jgi:hypothetical protein
MYTHYTLFHGETKNKRLQQNIRVGDEIRRPSFNFVTLRSFQSYNDDFQQRMLMWSLFLWWENSLNPYDSNDTLHGFIGWVQWHIEEKLHKICKFKIFFSKMSFKQPYTEFETASVTRNILFGCNNHYLTFFGKSFKEELVESLMVS